ncbi:DUF3429 domain-containing protein [Thalassospira lucentensis]|uniref:DUF3429 domain-containing protein n=1 Tax=Thalassospira lucentensis TaxID=168935 RepID=UPI00142E4FC2|nr:DUF3429 domain-containing protein [Thalassospira lucentensis]NIZ02540.1 DUF3429 domain-containing protein [Thalassospira lucentensis]
MALENLDTSENSDASQQGAQSTDKIPAAALWLGGTGAIPFVALALVGYVFGPIYLAASGFALLAYGAVILSFLGGIHWGRAIGTTSAAGLTQKYDDKTSVKLWAGLGLSVVPSLIAWGALILPVTTGLIVLAISFGGMLLVDLRACAMGIWPRWYGRLRIPLSLTVIASLLLGWGSLQ